MVSANTVKAKYVGMGWGRTIMIFKKNQDPQCRVNIDPK